MLDVADAPPEVSSSNAPIVAETAVPTCEVCGGTATSEQATGFDYELLTCRNRWTYVRCDSCRHVWLNPRPTVDELDIIYPPSYYAYNYDKISPIARHAKAIFDTRKVRTIISLCGSVPSEYLDVGCGDGRYLRALERRGVPRAGLHGLELDGDIVERLRSDGLDVHQERVETCTRFVDGTFDLITMFHVIEHVESPRAVVERLAAWLAPSGVLALETPNIDSLDARLFSSGTWGGYHIPRHWHLFHASTMSRLLESAGFRVEAIRYQPGHAFWMYSIHHELRYRRRRPHPRLARRFDPFASVVPLAAFTGFDYLRKAAGAKTSAMLLIARRES